MAFNTSSWSVKEEVNKAKLKLVIPNFSEVLGNTSRGQGVISKQFDVGGTKFALEIYPKGYQGAEEGMLSAFLCNQSNHDVVVDFTISVEGGHGKGPWHGGLCQRALWGELEVIQSNSVNILNGPLIQAHCTVE